jgi:putative ABC transport system ATP-binding protein
LIEVIDLHKDYRVGKMLFPALHGINLMIQDREFTALAGPSGSGKTTLLNIIGCLDVPTEGEVVLNGVKTVGLKARAKSELRKKEIGFVFQTFNLIPVLTAYENVEIPLILLDLPPKEKHERVVTILKEVGLEDYLRRRPNEMSGGQQQRVAIARALVKKPSLVLADEPTANLDSNTAREILGLMKGLNEKHQTTFVFSTHDSLVMEYARRLINLRDGQVESERTK